MPSTKRAVLTVTLPPTPCTPEMREKMVALASVSNKTIAEIQREAFSLFLLTNDRESIITEREVESI